MTDTQVEDQRDLERQERRDLRERLRQVTAAHIKYGVDLTGDVPRAIISEIPLTRTPFPGWEERLEWERADGKDTGDVAMMMFYWKAGFLFGEHYHDEEETLLIVKGTMLLYQNMDGEIVTQKLSEGESVVIPAKIKHDGYSMTNVIVHATFRPPLVLRHPGGEPVEVT